MKKRPRWTLSLTCLVFPWLTAQVMAQLPPIPINPVPIDGATEISPDPVFSWTTSPGSSTQSFVGLCHSLGTGDETWSGANRMRANVITVPIAQTLAEFSMELSFTESVDVHYYILEATSAAGAYTPVFHQVTTHAGTGRHMYSSGPIQYTLLPGRYYAVGAAWGNVSVSYFRQRTALPGPWALGTVHGYVYAETAPPYGGAISGFIDVGIYSMELCFPNHDLYLGRTPDALSLVASNVSANRFALDSLDLDATYHWQVVAQNAGGRSTGAVWRFTTVRDAVHFAEAGQEVSEGAGTVAISVVRENPAAGPVSVHYAATNGTATPGIDFTPVMGTLDFPGGVASTNFQVALLNDGILEDRETIQVWLTQASSNVAVVAPASSVITINDDDGPPDFQVAALSSANSRVIDHNALTGDDRGGIALSSSQVFVTGDGETARFNADNLGGGTGLGIVRDGLCSDLLSETLYTLGNGSTPLTGSGGPVTSLIELDAVTGEPSGTIIPLSQTIPMGPSGNGIFSGYGRVAIYTDAGVFDIWLPSGEVRDLGVMPRPNWYPSESWSIWGVAEQAGGQLMLAYRDGSGPRIVRSSVPDGTVSELADFTNLSDLASWVVSPSRGRWYFHYEGAGQFGGSSETLGYADATVLFGSTNPPVIISSPADRTVGIGNTARFCVTVFGAQPLSYQWVRDGQPIAGATESCYALPDSQLSDSDSRFSCLISNSFGSVLSSEATLTVLELGTFFDDFDPDIDLVQWSSFGGVVGATVLATNYGGAVSGLNSLWFGASGVRYAETRPLDAASGGELRFWLRLSDGSSSTWESADLPGEGVVVEYSINGGSSWVEFGRYDTPDYATWTEVVLDIPAAAQTTDALFRWRQLSNSGDNFDHWALDDVGALIGERPPSVRVQPSDRTALLGGAVSFSVQVSGTPPLSFQWRKDGTNLVDAAPVSGVRSNRLEIAHVRVDDEGLYSVRITNAFGAVLSSNAALTVLLPLPPEVPTDPMPSNAADAVSIHTTLSWQGGEGASAAGANVLLIWDVMNSETEALINALTSAGINLTLSETDETGYDGTNPSLDGFDAVVHLNGDTFEVEMPLQGQQALVDFVRNGGGYLGSQWSSFEILSGRMTLMRDLVLFDFVDANFGSTTISAVPGMETHPVLLELPSSFTFDTGWLIGGVHPFEDNPAVVLMRDASGNDAVAVREYGAGRVVGFHHSGSYFQLGALANRNVQQLYINGIAWSSRPTREEYAVWFGTDPGSLSLVATNLGRAVWDPGALAADTVYYWQVVAANALGTATGAVWQFTTARDQIGLTGTQSAVPEAGGFATITVERENPDSGALVVQYTTTDGTATAGADYLTAAGTLEFPAGVRAVNFRVPVLDDDLLEGAETIHLEIDAVSSNIFPNAPVQGVLTILDDEGPADFRIAELSTNNSLVVDHETVTGDDRGGIAVSTSHVYVTGDSATARFSANDLSGGAGLGFVRDNLCTDLSDETVYLLANGVVQLTSSGGTVTTLLRLSGPGPARVSLSQSVTLPAFGNGVFSGYGRIVLYNGSQVYDVLIPSGHVVNRGSMTAPPWTPSESWAVWGVAEQFGGELYLAYRGQGQRVQRARVPDGRVTDVGTFTDLSDMASFVVSPSRDRWYFHYEGFGQFGGVSETLGYADASFVQDLPPVADAGPDQTNQCAGAETMVRLDGSGSADPNGDPLTYEWSIGGAVLGTHVVESVLLPQGVHEVTLTVKDPVGILSTDTAVRTVEDSLPPAVVCPTNVIVAFEDENGAVAVFEVLASDECSAADLHVSPASGSLFPIGTTLVESLAADDGGNQSTCRFEVIVLGPRDVMQQVLSELASVQAECDDAVASRFLRRAVLQLEEALAPELWLDETHIRWRDGDAVYRGGKDAVGWLRLAAQRGGSCLTDTMLVDFSERLVRSLRLLAVRSIRDAEVAGVRSNQMAEQLKQLEKGDRFGGEGLWLQAIESYRHAWKQSAHMTIKTFTRLPGGAIRLDLVGPEGAVYAVEASTNLVNWERLGPVTAGEEGQAVLLDPAAADCNQRYYRLVKP